MAQNVALLYRLVLKSGYRTGMLLDVFAQNRDAIGRVSTKHPKNSVRFYLRLLLKNMDSR